jgi:DNA modification methylase
MSRKKQTKKKIFAIRYNGYSGKIITGDCQKVLEGYDSNTFDLIITSPPYADARKKTYGGIHPDEYVEWFLPKAKEFKRVLKPTGSFILNIKERVFDGERHTYVIDLIKALKDDGWLWTEEYIWKKKNSFPGKWPNRFRDSWERCLHFTKQKKFSMYQDAVMIPIGEWAKPRLKNLSAKDKTRTKSTLGNGFGINISNWVNRDKVYPTNVLDFIKSSDELDLLIDKHIKAGGVVFFPPNVIEFATECGNKNHSAAFPVELPEWFIKLFTQEGDLILDPFSGSGTTGIAAKNLNRNVVLIDKYSKYNKIAFRNLSRNEK